MQETDSLRTGKDNNGNECNQEHDWVFPHGAPNLTKSQLTSPGV